MDVRWQGDYIIMNKSIILTAFPLMIIGCGGSVEHNLGHIPVKWDNTIEYYMDCSLDGRVFIINNIYDVLDSLEIIVPALTFHEVSEPGIDVVTFKYITGINQAYIGKVPNSEVIISSTKRTTAEHEIRHMLGIPHEHQRPDRDDYINIDIDTVKDVNISDFDTKGANAFMYDVYAYEYDTKSIMHYAHKTYGISIKSVTGKTITYNHTASKIDNIKLNDIYTI